MVCKEEVFTWFQNLKGSNRIEAMHQFLLMCYPLELRFYGTCLENLCRKDFYLLKEEESKANDPSEVHKIKNINDPTTLSKLIVYVSLLHSSNLPCARELFKVMSEEMTLDALISLDNFSDNKFIDQYLLLLSMALHHPAFDFEQQMFFADLSSSLESYICDTMNSTAEDEVSGLVSLSENFSSPVQEIIHNLPPLYSNSSKYRSQGCSQIKNLKVKPSQKKLYIKIKVYWENKITEAFKTPHDLVVFHQKLIQIYPSEAKNLNQDKFIPAIPYALKVWKKQSGLSESIIAEATDFIQQLQTLLPSYILQSDIVRNFFMPSKPSRSRSKSSQTMDMDDTIDTQSKTSRLPSLTIYNSQISDCGSPRLCPELKQRKSKSKKQQHNSVSRSSPFTSPMETPISSPVSSSNNSPAPSPWVAAQCNGLSDKSRQNSKTEEFQAIPIEKLKSLGLLDDDKSKPPETERKSLPNGFVNCYLPKDSLPSPNVSNHNSPGCSENSSQLESSPLFAMGTKLNPVIDDIGEKGTVPEPIKPDNPNTNLPDQTFKLTEDETVSMKTNNNINRPYSIIPFTMPYTSIISTLPPPHNMKPLYLPVPCRTNSVPQHISPVIFDSSGQQYTRVPSVMPSALTFMPPTRSHTPERVLPSPPFPIVATSGCTTAHIGTCSVTTQRSSTVTVVTNSRNPFKHHSYVDKSLPSGDAAYASYPTGFILNSSTAASCSCYTTTSARASPSPSPVSIPQTTTVSMPPYLGMPYLFHSAVPFIQQTNGFIQQGSQGGFTYAIPQELIYPPGPAFAPASVVNNHQAGVVQQQNMPVKSCYNCGRTGHRGNECKEPTMDAYNQGGRFQLNYKPPPKMQLPDS